MNTAARRAFRGLADPPRDRYVVAEFFNAMNRQQVLDLYFLDARHKLIEIAAFLDRLDRAEGTADFRLDAFRGALRELDAQESNRAERVLVALSDPTTEPVPRAAAKGAVGAWPGAAPS